MLKDVKIGNGVTSIGIRAFEFCTELVSATIGTGVVSIGGCAFCNCKKLKSITIPDSVISIGNGVFQNCYELESVKIGDSVELIDSTTFQDCKALTSIVIPDSATEIRFSAFNGCEKLESVTIGSGCTLIGNDAFSKCTSLTSVTIPDSVTVLGLSIFQYCTGLERVKIGGGIEGIERYMFEGCTALKGIEIPNAVTSIGNKAFYGCDELSYIYYVGNKAEWSEIKIDTNNEPLKNAEMHYNYTGISGMEILSKPTKLKYRKDVGKLDLTGGYVKVTYNTGTTKDIAMSQLNVAGFDNTKQGVCELKLIYCGFSVKMSVEIVDSRAKNISISNNPEKLFYKTEEAIDVTGGRLSVDYYDDTTEQIDMTADMLTGYDSKKYGEQKITVAYADCSTGFTVEVYKTGDIDGDSNVNAADIAQLKKCLLSVIAGNRKFDINDNGEIDIIDLVCIKKLSA